MAVQRLEKQAIGPLDVAHLVHMGRRRHLCSIPLTLFALAGGHIHGWTASRHWFRLEFHMTHSNTRPFHYIMMMVADPKDYGGESDEAVHALLDLAADLARGIDYRFQKLNTPTFQINELCWTIKTEP